MVHRSVARTGGRLVEKQQDISLVGCCGALQGTWQQTYAGSAVRLSDTASPCSCVPVCFLELPWYGAGVCGSCVEVRRTSACGRARVGATDFGRVRACARACAVRVSKSEGLRNDCEQYATYFCGRVLFVCVEVLRTSCVCWRVRFVCVCGEVLRTSARVRVLARACACAGVRVRVRVVVSATVPGPLRVLHLLLFFILDPLPYSHPPLSFCKMHKEKSRKR